MLTCAIFMLLFFVQTFKFWKGYCMSFSTGKQFKLWQIPLLLLQVSSRHMAASQSLPAFSSRVSNTMCWACLRYHTFSTWTHSVMLSIRIKSAWQQKLAVLCVLVRLEGVSLKLDFAHIFHSPFVLLKYCGLLVSALPIVNGKLQSKTNFHMLQVIFWCTLHSTAQGGPIHAA